MYEFHVGDRVYVPHFDRSNRPGWAVSDMDKLSGKVYTVKSVDSVDGLIEFVEVAWAWKPDWLLPVYDFDVGDCVYVRTFDERHRPYEASSRMDQYEGTEHMITNVFCTSPFTDVHTQNYLLDGVEEFIPWPAEMLEPADLVPEFESESTEDLLSLFGFAV